jgi:transposase-like protein
MNFPFNCLGCGHENHAGWSQVGQRFWCRACGRAAIVPAPMEPFEGGSTGEFAVRFACPVCGRSFATKPALAGQKIRCSGCKAGVRVPAANAFPVEHASRVVLNGLSGSSRAIARTTGSPSGVMPPAGHRMSDSDAWDFPLDGDSASSRSMGPTTERRSRVGPAAGDTIANARRAPLQGDSGFSHSIAPAHGVAIRDDGAQTERDPLLSNDQLEAIGGLTRREQAAVVLTSRGEMMEQVLQETARQDAAEITKNAEKAKKAKRKQRKKTSFFDLQETLTMLVGVGVVVAVLGFLAWRFPEFRFPLAGLLVVIGAVLYLLGAVSLRRVADNESFLKSMAFRFCPPYQLWYVLTHWGDTQDFFAFFVSGLMIVAIGLGVFRTSPTFKTAEDSEREYQVAVDEAVRGKLATPLPPLIDTTVKHKP